LVCPSTPGYCDPSTSDRSSHPSRTRRAHKHNVHAATMLPLPAAAVSLLLLLLWVSPPPSWAGGAVQLDPPANTRIRGSDPYRSSEMASFGQMTQLEKCQCVCCGLAGSPVVDCQCVCCGLAGSPVVGCQCPSDKLIPSRYSAAAFHPLACSALHTWYLPGMLKVHGVWLELTH